MCKTRWLAGWLAGWLSGWLSRLSITQLINLRNVAHMNTNSDCMMHVDFFDADALRNLIQVKEKACVLKTCTTYDITKDKPGPTINRFWV